MSGVRVPRGDAGAGAVLVLALVASLVAGVSMLSLLAAGLAARQHARTAADLAALAAARTLALPDAVLLDPGLVPSADLACDRAATAAERNGAALSGCSVGPGTVVAVTVSRAGPFGQVNARARAGPRPEGNTVGPG